MKKFVLLQICCALTAGLLWAQATPPEQPAAQQEPSLRQINKIHIEAFDVFDPKIPQYRKFPFSFLNKIHIRTDESFIRRELIVREGDYIDQDLLEEAERNLRKHSFFGEVKIRQEVVGVNKVDLYVHTEDQWTTQLDFSAGKSSGYSTYQIAIEESNFLGLGKKIGLAYDRDTERTTYGFLYFDPQFLNSRWNFETSYETASDGWRYTADMVRPFYSLDTKWAYGMLWDSGTFTRRLHYKGRAVAEIDTDHRTGLFYAARSWGERYDKRKLGLLLSVDSLLYPNPARIIYPEATTIKSIKTNLHPIDREDFQFGAIFKLDHEHFIEKSYLDNFGRIEDLPQGSLLATTLTRSEDHVLDYDYFLLNTLGRYTRQFGPSQYLAAQGQFIVRRQSDGRFSNMVFSGYAHYYLQMSDFHLGSIRFPRQTMAVNLSSILTSRVDAPFQISLGENEGLRGYEFKYFTGQNSILFNLEDRIFTPFKSRLFGIGLVGFLDAGYVWSGDEHLKFSDLPVSVGFGLRLALKKAQSARVIRIDFAVPLRKEISPFGGSDQKGYSISVSSSQIFPVLESLPKLFSLF